MKPEIQLNSRYGEDNRLIRIDGEESLKFKLKTQSGHYRIGFRDETDEEVIFIDPSGGPFITKGSEIDGHIVKAVYREGIVEFES